MSDRIMTMLADITGGKSYKAHKYGLDHAERPFIDYGEDSVIWMKTAETTLRITGNMYLLIMKEKKLQRTVISF